MTLSSSIEHLQPIRLMRNASTYNEMLRRKFSVPRKIVNPAISGLKHALNPSEKAVRTRLAHSIGKPDENLDALREDGFVLYKPGDLPDFQEALEKHRPEIDERIRLAGEDPARASANKSMLHTIIANNGFFDFPGIMRFAISRPIVELATHYFGRVPLLTACSLWWSPPNDSLQQSQLFHCDGEDTQQLKFFFNINEVTPECGPFTLLPAGVSDRVRAKGKIVAGKVEDEKIKALSAWDDQIVLTGPTGAGACVDTCRCLHYGSRGNDKPRAVLMMRFNDHLAPNVNVPDWHLRAGEMKDELDDLQKLVLGIRAG